MRAQQVGAALEDILAAPALKRRQMAGPPVARDEDATGAASSFATIAAPGGKARTERIACLSGA